MRFIPLGNKPNISSSRNRMSNISMRVDSRGLPHITWMENRNGHNSIHYNFWDGMQWTYHKASSVGWSEEDLIGSNSSILLRDGDSPNIIFGRSFPNSSSIITIASAQENSWLLNEIQVDYVAKWVGILEHTYNVDYSSSSSESEGNSSSSSSSSVNSSESSSSSTSESSSSSRSTSSESSPNILSYNSSSSSADDIAILALTLDSDNILRVYDVRSYGWSLITSKELDIADTSTFKVKSCGKYLGLSWSYSNNIYYNFFNIDSDTWSYGSYSSIALTGLESMDVEGFYEEDEGKLLFVSVEQGVSNTNLTNIVVSTDGSTSYIGSNIIESETRFVTGDNDYVSSGYSDIYVSRNSSNGYFNIIATGARIAKYAFDGSTWTKTWGSIDGISSGFDFSNAVLVYDDVCKMAFINRNGGVYYFNEDLDLSAFSTIYPSLTLFTGQRIMVASYQNSHIDDRTEISCTWGSRVGDILKESITKVSIIVDDFEDPLCYSSSSTSSSSSIDSSSSSSSSSQSSSSSSTSSSSSSS